MFEGPTTAEWAASDASHARKRTEVIEKRLELLRMAFCGEPFTREDFAKRWADCDPPPPVHQPIDWSQWQDIDPYRRLGRSTLLGDE